MDERWKDWDVVKNARSTKIPGFMIPPGLGPDILEAGKELVQNEWSEFVEILDSGGPGAGYQRLLTLRERMEERKREISGELEKWEDREDWLGKLKGHYCLKLQDLAGIENPSAIWGTHGVNDPVEQLPDAAQARADEPIVETFLEFDDDGRLEGEPELDDGWTAYAENVSIGWLLDGTVGEFVTDGPEPRRENMTVRYRLLNGDLERAGIDPDNLEPPRSAIEMTPSTTWREALLQIEEKEQSVRGEKRRPKRTVRVLDFRLRILENVLYRFETFGSVDRLPEGEAKEIAEESAPGRRSTLNDPEAHPAVMLKAVLEWTDNDSNRAKPFRSENQPSLCGHVSKRLEEPAGYVVPQETIKTRLRSLMSELGVELPYGHTNKRSYFESREEITEAMQEKGLV